MRPAVLTERDPAGRTQQEVTMMAKKFSLLLAAAALLAFAVPAFANAAPAVTQPAGKVLATPAAIVGTSSNTTTETELGELSCENVTINASLTENTGSSIMASSSGEGSTSNCLLEGEIPITVTDPTLTTLTVTPLTVTAVLDFTVHLPGGVVCTFSGSVMGSYATGGSSLHIGGTLSGGACGSATISGDYSLKHAGSAVILD